MTKTLTFIEPRTEAEMAAFRALNWDYRDFLLSLPPPDGDVVRIAYPEAKYTAILDAAETANRPPRGMMRLVLKDGVPVGCGTIQTLAPGDAEIKRVWIAPGAQGLGAGRALMERLIADCRAMGFARILMDTGRPLVQATKLYDSMGFTRRGPYQEMPPEAEGIMIYFEMRLG
jgi:ribosomal protein S18 acetylase RimI-like enzyme